MPELASGPLAELAPLLFPSCCKERLLVLLAAYFDDSGTHRSAPVITVGGYWSTVDRWVSLAEEWRQVLGELRLPFFRMSDFENRHSFYRDWTPRQHDYAIKRLVGIVKRLTLGSVATSLLKESYRTLDQEDRRTIGTPQTICTETSMANIVEKLKREHRREHVAYFIENGPGWDQVVQRSQDDEWRVQFRVASLSFVNKKDYPQLQTADVLAYEAYKDALRHCGIHARPRRRSLDSLLKRGSHNSIIYRTEDHVRSIVEMVSRV